MLKAINPSITPAAAGKVAPSNVIAFPGGRAAAPCQPIARVTPHDIERSIARVAAIPAADLLGKAELGILMAKIIPGSRNAPPVVLEAMLCLARWLDNAGFPVPAVEARS
jgi:hypothetical protein